jgi:hypothetical protein
MGKKPFFKYFIICLFVLGLINSGHGFRAMAQEFAVSATPDSTLMVIGGQMNLTLEVAQPNNINVVFPQFPDTITKNIEVVESTGPDTTVIDQHRIAVTQVLRITSFDSGLHYIPPMEFELASADLQSRKRTKSIGIMVVNPFENVDPQKGITDIKVPIDTPFKFSELYRFLPWILGALAVALLIGAGIWFYIKKRNPLKALIREKPKESPHVIALRKLDHIKKEKLWQKGQVKQFYSDISEILRHYIEDRYGVPAPEQITSEIMAALRNIDLPDDKVASRARQILDLADLVKFAKFEPLPDENDISLMNSYFFVNQTKYEAPQSEEEKTNELKEKESEKQVKQ